MFLASTKFTISIQFSQNNLIKHFLLAKLILFVNKKEKKISSAGKQLIFPSKHTTKYPEFSQKWKNFFFVLPKQREKSFNSVLICIIRDFSTKPLSFLIKRK